MAQWKSILGCHVPQDAESRAICLKEMGDDMQGEFRAPFGKDPMTAAQAEVLRKKGIEELKGPFGKVPGDKEIKEEVGKTANMIANLLEEQKKMAIQENQDKMKMAKKMAEEFFKREVEKRGASLAAHM